MAPGTDVAVVVPRRADGGRRDELWAWCSDRWFVEHPTFRVVEGHHHGGPFNRSAAINAGVAAAGDFDVLVIADGDVHVAPDQLLAAIEVAERTGQVTFAHDEWRHLTREMSDRILAGHVGPWEPGVDVSLPLTQSSMVVVPATLWRELGGADEGFVGWGGEDIALSIALRTLGGGCQRVAGPVWHLWHPGATDGDQDAWTGRLAHYAAVDGDPAALRALLDELRPATAGARG